MTILKQPFMERNIRGQPYITVSAKGISNGLSDIPNDGADFGVDTLSGATSKGQYGPPYTQIVGIQEAINYAIKKAYMNGAEGFGNLFLDTILLLDGIFYIYQPFTISSAWTGRLIQKLKITGQSSMSPYIYIDIPAGTPSNINYAITLDPNSFSYTNIEIDNIQPTSPTGNFNYTGFLNADFSTTHTGQNTFQSYNWDNSNQGFIGLNAQGFGLVYLYNFENYAAINYINSSYIATYGGSNMGAGIYPTGLSPGIYVSGGYVWDYAGILTPYDNTTFIYATGLNNNYAIGIYKSTATFTIGTLILENIAPASVLLNINPSSGLITINNLIVKNAAFPESAGTTGYLFMGSVGASYKINNANIENLLPNSYGSTWGAGRPTQTSAPSAYATGAIFTDMVINRTEYKKCIVTLDNYVNNTTNTQTVNYAYPFSSYAIITANNTGLTASTSLTGITITGAGNSKAYSGIVIVEGY